MLLEKNPASGFACLLQETRGSLGMRIMRNEVVSNTIVGGRIHRLSRCMPMGGEVRLYYRREIQ